MKRCSCPVGTLARGTRPALLVVILFSSWVSGAASIQLRPQTNVMANGVPLDLGTYAIPCVADWNGDGLPDLIVGYQPDWKIALFTNSGTLAQPVFTSFVNLQAGGADIYVPASGCGSPAPFVCDYDHDGKRDLLLGDGGNGKVYFYKNTNTDARPILVPGVTLKLGAADLTVTNRATPYVYDWDGDGLKDLLCGDGNGNVHFFKNVGTAQAPAYATEVKVQAGGTNVQFGIRSVIRMFDWNGDGKMDLIGTGDTYAGWCRNIGSGTTPTLAAPVALQVPAASGSLANLSTGSRMRFDVTDWNHDGAPDLVIGDSSGAVFLFEGYRFGFQTLSCPAPGSVVLKWDSARYLRYKVLGGTSVTNLNTTWAASVASEGKTTCWTNTTSDQARFYRVGILP